MKRSLVLLALMALTLAACGTDSHVSGTITDTTQIPYSYSCGTSKHPATCFGFRHYFTVDGQIYQNDSNTYFKGDEVSFDYNTVWGVSNFHDSTYHAPDYSWIWVLIVLGVIGVAVIGGMWWYENQD